MPLAPGANDAISLVKIAGEDRVHRGGLDRDELRAAVLRLNPDDAAAAVAALVDAAIKCADQLITERRINNPLIQLTQPEHVVIGLLEGRDADGRLPGDNTYGGPPAMTASSSYTPAGPSLKARRRR